MAFDENLYEYLPMVSIIIPVYNARQYLCQCLDSLVAQTFQDYEIICVDDGSTDGSDEVLEMYRTRNERIKVIHQTNQGAGTARNRGMSEARGKYILFLDADDIFCDNLLEDTVAVAEKEKSEIVVFNAEMFDNVTLMTDVKWSAIRYIPSDKTFSAKDFSHDIFNFTIPAAWNKLFSREYIEKKRIMFQEISSSNDLAFVYSALSSAEFISIYDKRLIRYRYNNPSSLQGSNQYNSINPFLALKGLREYLELSDNYLMYEESYISMASSIIVYNFSKSDMQQISEKCLQYEALSVFNEIAPVCNNKTNEWLDEKVLIYGAGMKSHMLIKCLVNLYDYKKENIEVAVTELKNNVYDIEGINVKSIYSIENVKKRRVIVCASSPSANTEMKNIAIKMGFIDIWCISDADIIGLWISAKNKYSGSYDVVR